MKIGPTVVVPLLLALGLPATAAEPPDYRRPGKDWGKGPVRWIMSEEEEREFKKLRADAERATFVQAFWGKRDPTPGTPQNEYEEIFWKRVEQADKSFTNKAISFLGSFTDMGRVFLLLGPPTKTDKDARQRSIWTYEPSAETGIKSRLVMTFAPGTSAPLLLDRKALEEYVTAHPETRGIGWTIPQPTLDMAAGIEEGPAARPDQELSPEARRQIALLDGILAGAPIPNGVPFQTAYDFYKAQGGTTHMVLTLEVPAAAAHGKGDAALRPYARLQPAAPEGKPVNLTGELPFVAAPPADAPQGSIVFQARQSLKPGRYKAVIVVEDREVVGQMGAVSQPVEVPDYEGREPVMSSVSLLAKITQLDSDLGPAEAGHGPAPYTFGRFRLVPRVTPVMKKTDILAFHYQVYNPAMAAGTGQPDLEATYSFFEKDAAGHWKPFRKPVVKKQGQVEIYAIELKDFLRPDHQLPADFKLEIGVSDKVSGKQLRREIPFSVRD